MRRDKRTLRTVLARIESPGALFFKLSLRGGGGGHYSRGGTIQEGALLFQSPT